MHSLQTVARRCTGGGGEGGRCASGADPSHGRPRVTIGTRTTAGVPGPAMCDACPRAGREGARLSATLGVCIRCAVRCATLSAPPATTPNNPTHTRQRHPSDTHTVIVKYLISKRPRGAVRPTHRPGAHVTGTAHGHAIRCIPWSAPSVTRPRGAAPPWIRGGYDRTPKRASRPPRELSFGFTLGSFSRHLWVIVGSLDTLAARGRHG